MSDSVTEQPTATLDAAGSASDRDLVPGTRLGRFVVLEKIGAGGMGRVYAGFDPRLRRRVALKLVRPDRTGTGDDRLLREAQAMARMRHPRVVRVLDFGRWNGGFFLTMELHTGPDLRTWLKNERRGWREVLDVFLEAGDGLAAAHEAGLVHRDFKASNVLFGEDERPRVADFGLAEPLARKPRAGEPRADPGVPASVHRVSESPMGTPGYLAPEVFDGCSHDPASDQFSFCVALSRALYGRHPFADDRGQVPRRPTAEHYRQPHRRGVPPWIARVLERGLAEEPADRWRSMKALLTALRSGCDQHRRRWAGTWAALALVGLAAAWMVRSARHDATVCAEAGRPLEKVWSPSRLRSIAQRFATSERLHARPTWERTRERLFAYTETWRAQSVGLCSAARVRDQLSEEVAVVRGRCLNRRLDELDTLLRLFEQADPVVVDRSLRAAESLGSIELCTEIVGLDGPSGRDPRGLLARSRILEAGGRFQDALDVARQAIAAAGERSAAGAEARLQAGSVLVASGRGEEAAEMLAAAARLADAAGEDLLRARALSTLMFVRGYHLHELDRADAMSETVEAVLTRLGWPREMELEYHHHRAAILYRHADYKAAETELVRSLELRRQVYGDDHPKIAEILHELGRNAQAQGRLELAMDRFRQSVEIRRRRLGPHHPELARSQASFGYSLLMNGLLEESVEALTAARLGLRQTGQPVLEATILNHLGLAVASLSRYREAVVHLETAAELFENCAEPSPVQVREPLFNLVAVAAEAGWWRDARDLLRRARAASAGLRLESDPIPAFFDLLEARIAGHGEGRAGRSEHLARQGLEKLRQSFDEDHPTHLEALDFQAETALGLARYAEARDFASQVLEARLRSRPEHPFLARTLRVLGSAMLQLGDTARASEHFRRSLDLQGRRNLGPWERALALRGLAEARWSAGAASEARELAGEALDGLAKVDSPRAEAQRQAITELLESWPSPPQSSGPT